MEKKTLISQREYARRRGCVPSYVNRLIKDGIVQLVNGMINPEAADSQIADYAAHYHDTGPKASNESADSIASHRKRQIAVVTALKQLQLDEENGLLLRVDELKAEFATLFTDLKTVLRGLPSKLSGELLHITKKSKTGREAIAGISKHLLTEIDAALLELSKWNPKKREVVKSGKGPHKRRLGHGVQNQRNP